MDSIVLGVDAGGSKTRVLVSTLTGDILADVSGPGAIMTPGDAEHCASVIASVVASALDEAVRPKGKRKAKRSEASTVAEATDDIAESAVEADSASDAEIEENDEESPYAEDASDDSEDRSRGRVVAYTDATDPFAEFRGHAGEDADDSDEEELDEDDDADDMDDDVSASADEDGDDETVANTTEMSSEAGAGSPAPVRPRPLVICAGVAGTGREEEQIALQAALTNLDIADDVIVETDATIALVDAFGEGAGIVLVAGTGSIAYGRSPAGMRARCGGWGITIGDEGSGAWIGRKALSVVAAAQDGREPETALTGALLTAAQVNEVEELIPWSIAASKDEIAALAPSVIAIAMQGDLRANAIIDMAVEELMLHIRALGKRLFVDERAAFDVALAGGLLFKGSVIRKRLEKRIKAAVPGATLKGETVDAARGAVKLAMALQTAKV